MRYNYNTYLPYQSIYLYLFGINELLWLPWVALPRLHAFESANKIESLDYYKIILYTATMGLFQNLGFVIFKLKRRKRNNK